MNTVRQLFNLPISTPRAILRCEGRINFYYLSSSIFSFIRQALSKLSPRYITYTSVNTPKIASLYFVNTQVFNTDYSKLINNLSGFLVAKIITPISNSFVNTSNNLFSFFPFRGFLSLFKQFSLGFSKCFLVCLKKMRIFYSFLCRKSSKGRNTDIYTNCFLAFSQRLGLYFTRQASIPLIILFPNGAGFNIPNNKSMKFNFNRTYFRKIKSILFNHKTYLRIGYAIIPTLSLKPRIANLLFASFNPAEKCLKSKVNSGGDILKDLGMNRRKRRPFFFQGRNRIALVKIANTFLVFFPRVFSLFKKMIIEPATFFKSFIKKRLLLLCGEKPVFVCYLFHIYILPLICLNVKKCSNKRSMPYISMAKARSFMVPYNINWDRKI